MINSGHTEQYGIKLTLNMGICILLHNNGYIKNKNIYFWALQVIKKQHCLNKVNIV